MSTVFTAHLLDGLRSFFCRPLHPFRSTALAVRLGFLERKPTLTSAIIPAAILPPSLLRLHLSRLHRLLLHFLLFSIVLSTLIFLLLLSNDQLLSSSHVSVKHNNKRQIHSEQHGRLYPTGNITLTTRRMLWVGVLLYLQSISEWQRLHQHSQHPSPRVC